MLPAKPKVRKIIRRDGQEVITGNIIVRHSMRYPSKSGLRFAKMANVVICDDTTSKKKLKKLPYKLSKDKSVISTKYASKRKGDKE